MRFTLIDRVLEVGADHDGIPVRGVAIKHVTAAEEYLADHFPGFPILPGVLMLEALVQTARHVAEARDAARPVAPRSSVPGTPDEPSAPWVLGSARAVKYGAMVPPGSTLRLEVELVGAPAGTLEFKGVGTLLTPGDGAGADARAAVSGRFTLRRALVD